MRLARVLVVAAFLLLLALVPAIAAAIGQPYYVTLFTRILIYGLAALGLNLILGYGGMVSFGHAMYLGIGAYAVGIPGAFGIDNGWVHLAAALACGMPVALVVGIISLRTKGMAFIMITLAFAQMLYFLAISLKMLGGDDGLSIAAHSRFGVVTLSSPAVLYYAAFAALLGTLLMFHRLTHARFGMVLRGCRSNEPRMAALGFPTLRYRLAAYLLSALVCLVAGVLLANLTRYAAPAYMQWTVSGELVVMAVLGGTGTLIGPVMGAAALIALEDALSSLRLGLPWDIDRLVNEHWMALVGILIVAVALTLKQGLYGALATRARAA